MNHLAVFVRRPELGRVKTRLSPALPPELSLELYRAMIADTLEAATRSGAGQRHLYWDGPGDGTGPAIPAGFREAQQAGGDLGERLERAFEEVLRSPADRAIVIGADCPELDAALLDRAFASLGSNDLVLGPTHDGGYYLVGLARRTPTIFRGIPWSTQQVLEQTLIRAGEAGLTWTLLPRLPDLDTPEDLAGLVAGRLVEGGKLPAHIVAALARMGLLPHPG